MKPLNLSLRPIHEPKNQAKKANPPVRPMLSLGKRPTGQVSISQTTSGKVEPLNFSQAAQILGNLLITSCGKSFEIVPNERRFDRQFLLTPRQVPTMSEPARVVYDLRNLPAWREVRMCVGIVLEGFGSRHSHDAVETFMMRQMKTDWYAWRLDGENLYIRPRASNGVFTADMIAQVEAVASRLERSDSVTLLIAVEIQIPVITDNRGLVVSV